MEGGGLVSIGRLFGRGRLSVVIASATQPEAMFDRDDSESGLELHPAQVGAEANY